MTDDFVPVFYQDARTGRFPVRDYLDDLTEKEHKKASSSITYLAQMRGYLNEPFARHIEGSIRELRVDFARNHHRIFYFAAIGRRIILLHAFRKNTAKTPLREIAIAKERHNAYMTRCI